MNQNARIALRNARERTGIEFVTVILKKIPDDISVGEYAAGLFKKWKIGTRTEGKGVLLLFVEATHTLKIEVSYELEGIFTDAFCSSFQPTVKCYYAGKYFGDVFCGLVGSMERRILVDVGTEPEAASKGLASDPELLKSSHVFLSGGGGIIDDEYFYEKDAKLSFIRPILPEKIREFDCDRDIDVVIRRYFKSLEEGINYPFLCILTEGSQMRRLEYPESAHFYKSRWEDCQRALPYNIKYKVDLAVVRFRKVQSWPIFLRRTSEGFWKVDEARAWVSSWQDFSANRSGPVHKDHPWMFAFPEHRYKKSLCRVPKLSPTSLSLKDEISRLRNAIETEPENAANYFKLADIFYWDALWIAAAIDLAEKGLELDPGNVPYRWLVILMRYRFPAPQPNAEHLEKLLEINPNDLAALDYYSRHHWHYEMNYIKAVKLLRRMKDAEKKLTNGTRGTKWRLDSYKENYWSQIAVDRNGLWRTCNYLYIFYVPHGRLARWGGLLLIGLLIVIWIIKRRRKGGAEGMKNAPSCNGLVCCL
jgi:tetratricopeptide (TPR) repeat protein